MADIYQSFLRAPQASHLAPGAALHYITTTTSIQEPQAIFKHLEAQQKLLQKTNEKVLSCVEGANGACIETETTYKFVKGGGVFLPQMDDNMLVGTTAVCAMIHIVQFDANRKISQIRLHWDQGTMLKQVEAIGKSGRNWPIKEGKAQAKLIAESVQSAGQSSGDFSSSQPSDSNKSRGDDFNNRLFAREEPVRETSYDSMPISPAAKPPNRQLDEILGVQGGPAQNNRGGPQGGASQFYQPHHLFDAQVSRPDKIAPTKETDLAASKHAKTSSNHWDFESYETPEKVAPKHNPGQERHFGYGIDEDEPTVLPKRPIVHAPRPDAKAHFNISDQQSPAPAQGSSKQPLSNISNVNNNRRDQDRVPHFSMTDDIPAEAAGTQQAENRDPKRTSNVSKARDEMVPHWGFEQSPVQTNKKIYKTAGDGMGGRAGSRNWAIGEEAPTVQYGAKGGEKQVYKTAGNGMGGKKGQGLSWSIGNED